MTSRISYPLQGRRAKGSSVRIRTGSRTHVACVNCKDRKVRCDGQVPACGNCQRRDLACVIEDPSTKQHQPRHYLKQLEQRVITLEKQLQEAKSGPAWASVPEREPTAFWDAEFEQSECDDLSSMIGTLSLNAAGSEPTYLGSSSAYAFTRFLKPSLRPAIESVTLCKTTNDESREVQAPEPCALPDHGTAIKLSNTYFNNIHPQYPFLLEKTFREWEDALADPFQTIFDPVPLFFLNMVYAIGATLLPNTGYSSEQLYASAMLFIDDILLYDNLKSIQAMLCCAAYSLRSPTGASQWKLGGQALRQCINLGYHRDQKRLKSTQLQFQQEMQKRAFWSAYVMECAASVVLGRPLSLHFQEIDVEASSHLPLDIDESRLTPMGIVGASPSSLPSPPGIMSYSNHGFRIRILLGRIQTALYSDCTLTSAEKYARVGELSAALEEWWAETPPPRVLPEGGALSFFMTPDFFNVSYNYAILQLYRVHIADRKNMAPDEVFLKCLHAARNICQGFRRQFFGKPTAYTWSAVHELFLAGLTYIYCLWTSPACRNASRYDQVSSMCTDCTVVLVIVAERWSNTAPFRDTFEVLFNRTMTMMADIQQGKQSEPALLSTDQGAYPLDLPQWIAGISTTGSSMTGADWLLSELVEDFLAASDPNVGDMAEIPLM
ncbi:hypothetical protein PFICI_00484 [Pestalotiopsis fici W106-1]|uniref:Zn(2)-C6 fungal-type domain-containing protein n=1 Tax=Pestalotiopsis fici (strain W106-1 / CGMCC3.15140) TaxID=1229662 RepID=W3XMZ4_PESFW|nr:uncharacterized protein PFICI_00484 [Pestalotiopsis fici W106-1]ETS86656.1 hypothetical protein PFICI_00484 [Pestalotiopsis fici W106-1]